MSSRDFGFSRCVSYALSQLQMADILLKTEQRSSMEAIYNGHDVFVWLPTGYGKSLCYQALPFIMDCKRGLVGSQERSLVLVVSPLIALMVDQVTSLRKRSVNCSVVTSSDGTDKNFLASDRNLSIDSIPFCTPETLLTSKWRHSIDDLKVSKQIAIAAFVVDEAHCVSKWKAIQN